VRQGASLREHGHGEYRLRYPMKLVNGKYQRISWDVALNEITAKMMELRKASGPDSVYFVGSSKHSNEQAYLLRKFVSFWGSNNCDHQARICHSTTVAGVANTWGYGAMTNSYNDMQNSKVALYIGSNAAEAHPVSMVHMLHAKETGCKMIVVDPRFTRTAAKADEYVRIRSGSDIPFLFGLLYHVFNNGWEDKKYIHDRVYGMDAVKAEVMAKWTPDKVEEACGVKEAQMLKVATMLHENSPGTIVWCMGQTQHTTGNAMVRASCILQLALGNVGKSGGGTNIFRGHDNVQGATDVGPNPDSLPGYYGIVEGAWKHFAKAWGVDFEWIKKQFASPAMMTKPGITVSRWIDGVLEKNDLIDQDSNLRGIFYWGHAPNSQTRGLEMKRAMDKLDLLVVVDPYPSATAAMAAMPGKPEDLNPNRAVYLLPAATQFETTGSATASNRSLQWREKVIEPLWESRTDHMIMYQFAEKLGFGKELVKNYKMQKVKGLDEPMPEEILREINRSVWTIGYTGQSPERLKAHMRNMNVFDVKTLKAKGGKDKETGYDFTGRLLRPALAVLRHGGAQASGLAQSVRHLQTRDGRRRQLPGELRCRARRREPAGRRRLLLAGRRHHHRVSGVRPHPAQEAGLVERPDRCREGSRRGQELEDRHVRRHPARGDESPRLPSLRQCQGARRGLELPRPDSPAPRAPVRHPARPGGQVPGRGRQEGVLAAADPVQEPAGQEPCGQAVREIPADHDFGRLVEYEGGGEETRSNPWLAELQQEMFVEINPKVAADRGVVNGGRVWVTTPTGGRLNVQALVTERVGPDTVFLPFHFSGRWQGADLLAYYPAGAHPIVRGEAVNTGTTYGYDAVTMMQETKTTICNIEKA
jgi:formate dehydrogenase major subunit